MIIWSEFTVLTALPAFAIRSSRAKKTSVAEPVETTQMYCSQLTLGKRTLNLCPRLKGLHGGLGYLTNKQPLKDADTNVGSKLQRP